MTSVGIVGAQNVGKSTLFNALIYKRKSITYDRPGVTRDLVSEIVDWGEGEWEVTDFPGLENKKNLPDDKLTQEAIERVLHKLESYTLLLWVVHRKGLTHYEHLLAEALRKSKRPVWLVVNFVDDPALEAEASEFFSLGFKKVLFVSALNGRNILELRNEITEALKQKKGEEKKSDKPVKKGVRVSIVGKPNAGKSTLFNTLLHKDRALVFDYPGTTRDAIEDKIPFGEYNVTLVDTAGLRKKASVRDSVEVFSIARTKTAISESDAVIYLLNCTEGPDRQNKTIIEWIDSESKPLVIGLNKADLLSDHERKRLEEDIKELQKQYWEFPYLFISANEPKKTIRLLQKALALFEKSRKEVSTSSANKLLQDLKVNSIMDSHGIKLNYITYDQKKARFIIFANKPKIPDFILRYISKEIRKKLNWKDVPLHIEIRKK